MKIKSICKTKVNIGSGFYIDVPSFYFFNTSILI
jgi:hypothetical protein